MTLSKHKGDVNLNCHSTNKFSGLTQRSIFCLYQTGIAQLQAGRFLALKRVWLPSFSHRQCISHLKTWICPALDVLFPFPVPSSPTILPYHRMYHQSRASHFLQIDFCPALSRVFQNCLSAQGSIFSFYPL